MRVLDLDMDYFLHSVPQFIDESKPERLSDVDYTVWSEHEVRAFLENNLGLSKNRKIPGRIVKGHNEAIYYWKELIDLNILSIPFEVIHIDSHADLGLGYTSWKYITHELLGYPVKERYEHAEYTRINGERAREGIGDYLLFAIAYRWLSKIVYCTNPNGDGNDYLVSTLKNFCENDISMWDEKPVLNTIQLLYNTNKIFPRDDDPEYIKRAYILNSKKEPEVPLLIVPTIDGVKYDGDFNFATLAQSPNYTPQSADYIMDVFREYILEQ